MRRVEDDYIREFEEPFRLEAASTALVIVDLQYATASWEGGLGRRATESGTRSRTEWRLDRVDKIVIPNLVSLISHLRILGIRIIYITSGSQLADFSDMSARFKTLARLTNNRVGTREHEIRDEVEPAPGDLVVNKSTISAFTSSNLEALLRALGIRSVLFAGVSTNTCVDSTARDAADRGFNAVLLADCCSAATREYHEMALLNFQRLFGRVENSTEVLRELRL